MSWKWILICIAMFIVVIFTVQNYETVTIKFLFWSFATSRAIVIFATLFLGIFIGLVLSIIGRKK